MTSTQMQQKQHVPTELGTRSIGSLLWQYSLPAIIAMAAASVYNIIDSIFVGQGVGDEAISGMAVASPFMNLSAAFGAMVGVGASTVISVRLGQGRYQDAQRILGNTVTMNIILGIIFTAICLPFIDTILYWFGASEVTLPYARRYMSVILYGNVITHMYFGLNAVLRSVGHPRTAMTCTFLAIIINCILDPLFIFVFKWGIQGAAWATIIAQIVTLGYQVLLFNRTSELLHFRRGIYRLHFDIVRQCLTIGLSPFLTHSCACLVVLFCNNRLAQYGGDMAIGAYGIVNRVVFLFVTIVFGLAQGMQPIIGYNWGARQNERVFRVLRYGIIGATCITTAAFLTGELIPAPVIHIFGAGPELTAKAVRAFHFVVAAFPLVGAQIIIGHFFQSIGHAGKSIFLSLCRQLLFLIPMLALLPQWWELDGVWMATPVSDTLSVITATAMLVYMIRKTKQSETHRTA